MSTIDSAAAGVVFAASAGPLFVAAVRSLARFRAGRRVLGREIRALAAPSGSLGERARRGVEDRR